MLGVLCRSYDLMRELQLGIMFSIANASKSRVSLAPTDITQEAFGLEVSESKLLLQLSCSAIVSVVIHFSTTSHQGLTGPCQNSGFPT